MKVSIIRKKRAGTGKIELLLRYYEKGVSKHKGLSISLYDETFKKLSNEEKRHNREKLKEAELICMAENEKARLGKFGIETLQKQRSSFIAFVERVANERNTSKGNEGNWYSMLKHLKEFAPSSITFEQVDVKFLNEFKEHLNKVKQNTGKPLATNSKVAYYNKLRAALKQAVKEDIIAKNPAISTTGFKSEDVERGFLTLEELRKLEKTECEIPILKDAFLFSCLTGMRWSDIVNLKWSDVFYDENNGHYIRFKQQKTKGAETLYISDEAFGFLGERKDAEERVFISLRYSSWFNLKLQQWVMKAGISKNITFHAGRHTFAVIQLDLGTDIYTLSKLLGHRDIKTTLVYSKILDKNKIVAANKIKLKSND
jgi:integrase